ncbi:putative amino acid/amine transport protein [Klebsiella pneumoniae]|uniref:Putative amino acid/amine transport protein n=1 Tax=Klebsiella pneumoniae TaxID=573 RepID=A0A378F686_KLEPN|nr:putative amino acid/amine transport protein [Klebsiella pneumoniae]
MQRVNPFKPLVVEEVVERAINNYEKQTRGEMTPDVLRPWFETPLMNAVQRDWRAGPAKS